MRIISPEIPNGGYLKENGITFCKNQKISTYGFQESCHMKCEVYHISGGEDYILKYIYYICENFYK